MFEALQIQWKKYWKYKWWRRKWWFWGRYMWQWSHLLHHPSTILVWVWTKNTWHNDSHEKKSKGNKHINISAADLLHIRIGNLDLCKCRDCKNEAGEIDSLCRREVDAMFIALAKIPECEGSISPSSFYGHLPDC